MDKLTDSEKYFLKELQYKPEWGSILKKLEVTSPKPYRPSAEDEERKSHKWIYESGRYHANRELLNVLMGVNDE